MKQIIVNVDGLTIEEKQRVSEALALIKNIKLCNPMYWDSFESLYGPSGYEDTVGFGYFKSKYPTHTPQQVLEMAGMAPATDQHVLLADMLIITDSAGNIIYDSTPDALNNLIKKRANLGKGGALPDNGVSVKLDKNGAAVMVEKRKVRKDFDPSKEYSVNVLGYSVEEKKEVQQAFFDAGFRWKNKFKDYSHLNAVQYTNTAYGGDVTTHLMYGSTTRDCNLTAKEFLELVYEPEQQGHPHVELMALYAEDAKTTPMPWKLWQVKTTKGIWRDVGYQFIFDSKQSYRRKPKTKLIHGVEVPDFEFSPKVGEEYYVADVGVPEFFDQWHKLTEKHTFTQRMVERGLIYPYTEEGKQAAILHSKIMLGMVQE